MKANNQVNENYAKSEEAKQWLSSQIENEKEKAGKLMDSLNAKNIELEKVNAENHELNRKLEEIYNSRFFKFAKKIFRK